MPFFNSDRWAWTLALLGWGQRLFTGSNGLLRYLMASSYPIYIVHLPIVTIVTFFAIRLPVSVAIKYVLIVALSTVACFGIYELLKQVPFLRFVMGMKAVGTTDLQSLHAKLEPGSSS